MFSAAELTACDPRIYISFLDCEAHEEALALQDTLHESRSCAVYCDPFRSDDRESAQNSRTAIHIADLVVVLGTKMYGKRTAEQFSTHDDLHYIVKSGKPILFVQMCRSPKYLPTRWLCSLSKNLYTVSWAPQLSSKPHLARIRPPSYLLQEIVNLGRLWNSRGQPCILAATPLKHPSIDSGHRSSSGSSSSSSSSERPASQARSGTPTRSITQRSGRPSSSAHSHQLRWTHRKKSILPDSLSRAQARTLAPADDIPALKSRVWAAVDGIRSHFDDPEAQVACLDALLSCVLEQEPSTAVGRLLARNAGFDTIASAMTAHLSLKGLQRLGCRILKHAVIPLAHQRTRNTRVVAPSAVVAGKDEEGEGETEDAKCKGHQQQPRTRVVGFKDCPDDVALEQIVTKSARVALHAMMTHTYDANVQTYACHLIQAMARHHDDGKTRVLRERAVTGVTRAMARHGTDSEVQCRAAQAFAALATQHGTMQRLVRDGGVSTLVAMLRRPVLCTEAIETTLQCLQLLGTHLQHQADDWGARHTTTVDPDEAASGTAGSTKHNDSSTTASNAGRRSHKRSEGEDSGMGKDWWEGGNGRYEQTWSSSRKRSEKAPVPRSEYPHIGTRVTTSIARAVECILTVLHEHEPLDGVQRSGVAALLQLLPLLPRIPTKECGRRETKPQANNAPSPRELYPQLFVALRRLEDAPPMALLEDHLSCRMWHF